MRSVALSGLFIVSALAMNAQKLSLTPQVGFENSRTSINYNGLGSFAPLGGELNPQVSLRLDYKFKHGFGPYMGASTSRSGVLYGFNDIENGMNAYTTTKANMQLRMEAGYQFTTKPIFFNKTKQSTNTSKTKSSGSSSCSSYIIAAIVQEVILRGQVIAKAKIQLRKKLKIKIKADGFVCSQIWA